MSTNIPNAAEPMGPPLQGIPSGQESSPSFPQVLGHPRPLWMLFMTEFLYIL